MPLYSHSKLGTYENCPLKYKYQYVDKVQVEKRNSIEAFLGSRCHESLEKLYRLHLNKRLWTKIELLQDFKDRWEKNWNESIFIVNSNLIPENYYAQGVEALSHYYERYHPFEGDKTLLLEQRVEISLDDSGQYRLQGYIDRLSETEDGRYQIHDYKTERTFKAQSHFDEDRQLALYQIGLSQMFADIREVELIWHYLIFDKEVRSSREKHQLEKLKIDLIYLIREIERATTIDDFPYRESPLCDWCDYYSICPAKKHFALTEKLPPPEFREEEGVKLVNSWFEIKESISKLETEKANLEDALFQYCRQLSVDVMRGSDCKLRVKVEPHYRPKYSISKNPEDKESFIQFLKDHGLYDQLISLNTNKINSFVRDLALDENLRQAMLNFLLLEESKPRFYPSKLKDSDY